MNSVEIFLALDMFGKLAVLCGVCVLLLQRADGVSRGGRTVTFRRTPPGEKRGQLRARPSRDVGDHKPPRGPPFTSCWTPLTPTEHGVLDDNTHEVRCWVTMVVDEKRVVFCCVNSSSFI